MDLADLKGKRLAAYVRRSRKEELRTGEQEVSTDQQLRAIYERAGQLGVVIPKEHVYNEGGGKSAYKQGVIRAKFDAMTDAAASRQVDGVMIWKVDRASRNSTDTARLETLSTEGAIIFSVTEGLMDPNTPMLELHGLFGKMTSKAISINSQRGKSALARTGKPAGGGMRRFGWERDGVTQRSDEVQLIQEAAHRIINGEGTNTVCKDWNLRGLRLPGGGLWHATPLRRVLMNPRTAGLRQHHGQVMRDDDGQEVRLRDLDGNIIPPILDRSTWDQARNKLMDPKRRQGGHPHAWLLSGIARCGGKCRGPLYGSKRSRDGQLVYRDKTTGLGGCNGTSINAEPLEKYVVAQTLDWLAGEGLDRARAQLVASDHHRAEVMDELQQAEADARQLMLDRVQHRISYDLWELGDAQVQQRIRAAREELDQHPPLAALSGLPNGKRALQRAWKRMPLAQRRAILRAVIDHLIIRPAVRGRTSFDPDRVDLVFRDREQHHRAGWRAGHDASVRRHIKAADKPHETNPATLDTVARAMTEGEQ